MILHTIFIGAAWRRKKDDHQNTVFSCSVLEWRCSCELLLTWLNSLPEWDCGRGQMLLYFKGRSGNCAGVTCIFWSTDHRFFLQEWLLGSENPSSLWEAFLEDFALWCQASQNLLLRNKSQRWLNTVKLEKELFSCHICPNWPYLENTR